jgi:homospermidine synthase
MSAAQVRERHCPAWHTPTARQSRPANPELETPLPVFGPAGGHITGWRPLPAQLPLVPDGPGEPGPWQFRNVLVH